MGRVVRFRQVTRVIDRLPEPNSILDAGCGDGTLSRWLGDRFRRASVLGIDDDVEVLGQRGGGNKPNVSFRRHAVGQEQLEGTFELIVCTDVLEHIPDDRRAFRWLADHLRPGGVLVLHVPAANQHHTFSVLDDYMSEQVAAEKGPHFREGYEIAQVHSRVEESGLSAQSIAYTFQNPATRFAVDFEQWTGVTQRRYLKLIALPALLGAALCERRPSTERRGHGVLVVARRAMPA